MRSCEGAGRGARNISIVQLPKMLQQKFDHFKLCPTSCNMLHSVGTGWPNVSNKLRATMFRDVALKCCVRLAGPSYDFNPETKFLHGSIISCMVCEARPKLEDQRRQGS